MMVYNKHPSITSSKRPFSQSNGIFRAFETAHCEGEGGSCLQTAQVRASRKLNIPDGKQSLLQRTEMSKLKNGSQKAHFIFLLASFILPHGIAH